MARKMRIEYAGAAYHVMARGNQGRDIYADDRDRKLWLETLGKARAGLIRVGAERLVRYRWSSYPWYVGGTEFKERMLAMVEPPLRQGRRGSYCGEAKRAHGEVVAERLLARGLAALELAEGQLEETLELRTSLTALPLIGSIRWLNLAQRKEQAARADRACAVGDSSAEFSFLQSPEVPIIGIMRGRHTVAINIDPDQPSTLFLNRLSLANEDNPTRICYVLQRAVVDELKIIDRDTVRSCLGNHLFID